MAGPVCGSSNERGLTIRPKQAGDGAITSAAVIETWEELNRWMRWAENKEAFTAELMEIRNRQVMASFVLRESIELIGIERRTGKAVVWCGFHDIDWKARQCDTGYWVRKSAQCQGLATETTNAMLRYAFGALGMQRVVDFLACRWCFTLGSIDPHPASALGRLPATSRPVFLYVSQLYRKICNRIKCQAARHSIEDSRTIPYDFFPYSVPWDDSNLACFHLLTQKSKHSRLGVTEGSTMVPDLSRNVRRTSGVSRRVTHAG